MDHTKLSKRLHQAGTYIPKGAVLADIGSDHAYLPAYLYLNEKMSRGIAGEVVTGPFESAKHLVTTLGITDAIDVRLGDGLDVVSLADEVTAISICGMGGSLIRDILDRGAKGGRLSGKERLVLQPNIGEPTLRQWLVAHQYAIVAEEILEENEKRYEIIVAEKSDKPVALTPRELLFGPHLVREKSDIFKEKWQQELQQRRYVLKQIKQSDKDNRVKQAEFEEQIRMIEEVLES